MPNVVITFALKSLTSSERKSMSLISDRMNSLEEKRKNGGDGDGENVSVVFKEALH